MSEPSSIYHIYYIDELLGHRYIADRKIVLNQFTTLDRENESFAIFSMNYGDGVPRELKGYKAKEIALIALEQIKTREEALAKIERESRIQNLPINNSVYQKLKV